MNYWTICNKFNTSFKNATSDEEQNLSIRVYFQELTDHGYVLPRHIQGAIKKGSNDWGLRKKDNRVQSDPYSAYNMR